MTTSKNNPVCCDNGNFGEPHDCQKQDTDNGVLPRLVKEYMQPDWVGKTLGETPKTTAPDAWEKEETTDLEKAIVRLYQIVGMSHVTPDNVAMAGFMLKDYEEERKGRYVRHLLEKIDNLHSLLAQARADTVAEVLSLTDEEIDLLYEDACHSSSASRAENDAAKVEGARRVRTAISRLVDRDETV